RALRGGGRRFSAGEVVENLLQEEPRVGLLVKAPHKEAVRPRHVIGCAQLLEEARGDSSLPCAAQTHESNHAAESFSPGGNKRFQFRFATHEVWSGGKWMDNTWNRGVSVHYALCSLEPPTPPR